MIDENKFSKILLIVVLVVFIGVSSVYGIYYNSKPPIEISNYHEEEKMNQYPINPFIAYSMIKKDLITHLGDGEEGEGISDDTRYIDYNNQIWFNLNASSRFYYGRYTRIYKSILNFSVKDKDNLYSNMKAALGEPLVDSFNEGNSVEKAYWIKDSVEYELIAKKDNITVESRLAYYDNPNDYDMGERPTIIQRINKDITGDGEIDSILLIGSKSTYTSTEYKNLYILIGNNQGAYISAFPQNLDGGFKPKLYILKNEDKNIWEIIVQADHYYINAYNVFIFEDGIIKNIYSSEHNPMEKN